MTPAPAVIHPRDAICATCNERLGKRRPEYPSTLHAQYDAERYCDHDFDGQDIDEHGYIHPRSCRCDVCKDAWQDALRLLTDGFDDCLACGAAIIGGVHEPGACP